MSALIEAKKQGYLISEKESVIDFNENWLRQFDKKHPDFTDMDKVEFIQRAQLEGADPRKNEIYLTGYFSPKLGRKVATTIISYHYLVKRAEEHPSFKGMTCTVLPEEVFNPHTSKNEKQLVATATIYRKGYEPYEHKSMWNEYNNSKNPIWRDKPYAMLRKCAIAGAIRMVFPNIGKGLMIGEEMERGPVKTQVHSVRDKEEIEDRFDRIAGNIEVSKEEIVVEKVDSEKVSIPEKKDAKESNIEALESLKEGVK
jgi:hypothetical protein